MQITIEKNIPNVNPRLGKFPAAADAFKVMDIGDSFLFPSTYMPTPLYALATNAGVKITMSKVDESQYRVWRKA